VYDFFLYALLAIYFAASFFPPGNEVAGLLFALATFGAGFIVRPLGALLFGSIGDRIGRKFSFLITVSLMGFATAAVGVLPTFETIGWAAPVLLLASRLLQGLSAGGEYGGAVTYIAEQTSPNKRGVSTSWLQTTATGGQLLALGVILGCQTTMSKEAFASWGWRIPFLLSMVLLVVSVYIRFGLKESPTFQLLKEAGKTASSPVRESFGSLHNCRKIIIAISICAAQGSIGYTGAVYLLYFLINVVKFDALNANLLMALAIIAGLPVLILAGKLSDVWGRKWIMVGACLLSALTFVPIFRALVHFGNPAFERFQSETPITVLSDNCAFHLFTGPQTKLSDCDRVKNYLNKAGLSYPRRRRTGGTTS
jgi:MFS family permease